MENKARVSPEGYIEEPPMSPDSLPAGVEKSFKSRRTFGKSSNTLLNISFGKPAIWQVLGSLCWMVQLESISSYSLASG